MKNLAKDIVELLNYIRPANLSFADKIFTNPDRNHKMKFKEGGLKYLKKWQRLCFLFKRV